MLTVLRVSSALVLTLIILVPHPALTPERDLDAQGAEKRLRPPQAPGERPRAFCPWGATRELVSSSLGTLHVRKWLWGLLQ
jgi:hypothetical protein